MATDSSLHALSQPGSWSYQSPSVWGFLCLVLSLSRYPRQTPMWLSLRLFVCRNLT